MTDLRERLRDADPLIDEPSLRTDDAAAMRQRVLETAREAHPRSVAWTRTLTLAAAVAVIAGAGIDTARRAPRAQNQPAPNATAPTAPGTGAARTQVHFSTPGGTRIVWTIDPAFHLTENR